MTARTGGVTRKFPYNPPRMSATRLRVRSRDAIVAALTALPLLALVLIIRRYHVDVFYWDQWELVPIVEKLFAGTLSFPDLWAQHNEHRPFFPRLVMAHLARATDWNTAAEVAVNVTMMSCLVPLLWWASRQWRGTGDRTPAWTWPTVSLLLFSPAQWENWLWGWQFLDLLQVATSVAGLALLSRREFGWGSWFAAVLLGIVGTFSFGAGLLYWPVGAIAILLRNDRARLGRTMAWTMVAVVVVGAYALDFHPNPYMPAPASNFVRVRAFGKFLFFSATFLGAPLAPHDWRLALLAGVAGAAAFAWATLRAWRARDLGTSGLLPFCLGLSAIATALMIALGRAGFGFEQALESRYVTASLWLWISVVLSLASRRNAASRRVPPWAHAAAVCIVACLLLVSWPHGRRESAAWQARLAPARDVLIAGTADFPMLKRLYPTPEAVLERRAMLERRRLNVFRDR